MTLAALAQVLRLYEHPEQLAARLPTLRLLTRPHADIRRVAERLAGTLRDLLPPPYEATVVDCASQIGSGALPVAGLPSAGVRIDARVTRRARNAAITRLNAALRRLPLPLVGRIDEGGVLLDCRCVEDESEILASLRRFELQP